MTISSPKHRLTLWILANASWIALVPASVFYFTRELESGVYPVDADSIGIPILGISVWVLILLLPLNLLWWFLLRQYPGRTPILCSQKRAPKFTQFIGLLAYVLAVIFASTAVLVGAEGAWDFSPIFLVWVYVVLAIRSAYVTASQRAPDINLTPQHT